MFLQDANFRYDSSLNNSRSRTKNHDRTFSISVKKFNNPHRGNLIHLAIPGDIFPTHGISHRGTLLGRDA